LVFKCRKLSPAPLPLFTVIRMKLLLSKKLKLLTKTKKKPVSNTASTIKNFFLPTSLRNFFPYLQNPLLSLSFLAVCKTRYFAFPTLSVSTKPNWF